MNTQLFLKTCAALLGRLRRSERGSAAAEFAMVAPILCFSLLAAVDVGTALTERVSMNHIVRSAAQVAMEDPGEDKVEAVMNSTASRNFDLAQASDTTITTDHDPITLSVSRYCGCPDQPEVSVSCSTICTGTVPTFIFYEMSAEKEFSGFLFRDLKKLSLAASAHVQVR